MSFFEQIGSLAIGSKLRKLSATITEDSAQLYEQYDIALKPKWFPVYYVLSERQQKTITSIAQEIGHTHPSVSKIVKEMIKADLVEERRSNTDKRQNLIQLSEKGRAIADKIQPQYTDVTNAINKILHQTEHHLWKAIEEWEYLLEQKSLIKRVQEERKLREAQFVEIIPYQATHQTAFKALNEEWISTYFKMEEADYKALDHPQTYILDQGGHIFVALYRGEPVGTCALLAMENQEHDFELAKMAVSPSVQGKGIGYLLGQKVAEQARILGAKKLYLESNTKLKPAIKLYEKLGFVKVSGYPTPYSRCNIQMELVL
ncbi:MAG: helix-turn-helix domain-containing GNAT family N-acetyltransferase, partial [Bacteroidota bacterium]